MRQHKFLILFILIFLLPLNMACSQEKEEAISENSRQGSSSASSRVLVTNDIDIDFSKHKVTFIELGADRRIPCKAM